MKIARASQTPKASYIAKPAASWLDDFLVWLSPEAFGCCRKFTNGSYCPPDDQPPCCTADEGSCGMSFICRDCTTSDYVNSLRAAREFSSKISDSLKEVQGCLERIHLGVVTHRDSLVIQEPLTAGIE
ncbi:hypothetical protein QJS10_CPB22g00909 [Acorus calamus]|uniref:Uncharacterized protein n=1 Tax=Acorus calamus TaxID=4465 RepID=A0AAV9C1C8_ACOCL|nr:hypothetical protein QJS10_CPB22g00909 [Acorus calamus]